MIWSFFYGTTKSYWKQTAIIVSTLAGKLFLSLIIVFASRFSINIIANAFGAGGSLFSFLTSPVLGVVLTVAMLRNIGQNTSENTLNKIFLKTDKCLIGKQINLSTLFAIGIT